MVGRRLTGAWPQTLAVGAGGAIGAIARVVLDEALPPTSGWPWSTFTANVLGALLLGYVATRLGERLPPSSLPRPFLATGVCGALTTFSTLQIQVIELARDGRPLLAAVYAATSVTVGLLGVTAATLVVRRTRLVG